MVNALLMALSGLLLLAAGAARGAEISVETDRTDVAVGESFELRLKATGEPDDGPDFEPLEQDFEILAQTQSQNIRILGDRSDRSQEWTLSLMPKRAGELRIPPIEFGADRSEPLTLQVRPARRGSDDDADVFLETELDTDQSWVGAQVVMTVRIFHAPELRGGRLQAPTLEPADATVEILGDDRSYHTRRGSRRYFVVERRFVIFPHSPGMHRVGPLQFQGQILEPPSRLDPFQRRARTVRIESDPLQLDVRPIPDEFANRPWPAPWWSLPTA